MSFATVYNTLDSLAALNLVGSIRLGTAVRFDPNVSSHHHAVCDRCGAVMDIASVAPSPSEHRHIARASGFNVRSEERTYRGICASCTASG